MPRPITVSPDLGRLGVPRHALADGDFAGVDVQDPEGAAWVVLRDAHHQTLFSARRQLVLSVHPSQVGQRAKGVQKV